MTEKTRTPETSRIGLITDVVARRLGTILGALLILGAVVFYFGIQPSVPREAKLFILTFLFVTPAGYLVGKKVRDLLYDPQLIYLLDLDARYKEGAIFTFPYTDFQSLDVQNGELDQVAPRLYIGKKVDIEAGTVKGTWRGTLDDRELLRALNKIHECRGQLEEDAKRGFAIETQAFTIIRNATRAATRSIVESFEAGTLPDRGESLGKEIDSALDQFDLDRKLRHIENPEQHVPEPDEVDSRTEPQPTDSEPPGTEVTTDD